MRRIRYYVFKAGPKLPFADLPAIVHRFLDEQGLKNASFLYHFKALEFQGKTNPCQRLYKDIPSIGEPEIVNRKGSYARQVITNMTGRPGVDEEAILPFMKKIARTYGTDAKICYFDVDFHGKLIFHAYKEPRNEHQDESVLLYGSGIIIEKDVFGAKVSLCVDEIIDGIYYDSKPYFDAFRALLNGQRCSIESIDVIYTPEELANAHRLSDNCRSAVEKARAFFRKRVNNLTCGGKSSGICVCSATPALKKEAKKRNYVYKGSGGFGWFEATKKTPNGNEMVFTFDHPQFFEVRIGLTFHAPGVQKSLFFVTAFPEKQQDYDDFVAFLFNTTDEYVSTLLPELDGYFTETPVWFEHEWNNPHVDPELC